MNRIALRLLFGDRAKYAMMISGIIFATVLMLQGMSLFVGLMSWTFAPVRNIRVPIWIADPLVEQVNDQKPLRDIEVQRVRSVPGVAWAAPLYQGGVQARLANGASKFTTLVGIDANTFAGAPERMIEGRLEDLLLPNTIIVDEYGVKLLGEGLGRPLRLGDVLELNDREARVVGICAARRSFTGGPFLYTTYDRAVSAYTPSQRRKLTFILAAPSPGQDTATLLARIRADTGLAAYAREDMMWSTVWWYVRNTGVPYNVGLIVLIGFVIGTAIAGQTFYAFVMDNIKHLGAMKAMGTSNATLCRLLLLQAVVVGLIGYGIGLVVIGFIGRAALAAGKIPFLITWHIPLIGLAAVLLISTFAALLGIWRVARVEPAIVFRS